MTERWAKVPDYPHYEVSDLGRVRSIDYIRYNNGGTFLYRGRILKTSTVKDGHLRVPLSKDGRQRKFLVHRLVLAAFVGPAPEGHEGCHNNGNPADNRLANLRWDTSHENQLDTVRHGHHFQANKTTCPRGHEYDAVGWNGGRMCRTCNRGHWAAYRQRQRERAA